MWSTFYAKINTVLVIYMHAWEMDMDIFPSSLELNDNVNNLVRIRLNNHHVPLPRPNFGPRL